MAEKRDKDGIFEEANAPDVTCPKFTYKWSAPCQVDRKIIKVYDEFLRTRLFIYAGIFNPIDKVILFLL